MRHSITGGAGFIGSHLADALVARGDSVVILDDFCTGSHRNIEHLSNSTSVSIVDGSILDGKLVDDLMGAVDICLHLASAVGVELVVSKPLESPAWRPATIAPAVTDARPSLAPVIPAKVGSGTIDSL
jgi:nucleoside-diphosphate-sugar epimerase